MTEKAFRSQGLALSEPVRIGDWPNLIRYSLTALAFVRCSGLVLEHPISLEQAVYLPGSERQGIWASPKLETVFPPAPGKPPENPPSSFSPASLQGDLAMVGFMVAELRRSYQERPVQMIRQGLMTMQSAGWFQRAEVTANRSRPSSVRSTRG
jgi:hypothetical protein